MDKNLYFLALTPFIWSSAVIAEGENEFTDGDEFADFYGQEELVSIATGTSTPISKAPSVASVISSEQIEAMGATHLDEVLERIPGLHVMLSDLSRLDPVYSIRGIQTGFNPQLLVMLNGTDIRQQVTGGLMPTFHLPVSNISRIEVIRGPGSAVYGADAFSGVVNIITRDALENQDGAAGVRAGSFGSRDLWVRKGIVKDNWSLSLSVENQTSDGDKGRVVSADMQTMLDQLKGTNVSHAPGPISTRYDVTNINVDLEFGKWSLKNWYWRQDNAGLGHGGARALDPNGYQDASQFLSKLSYRDSLTESLQYEAKLSYLHSDIDTLFNLFPAGAKLPIAGDGNMALAGVVQDVTFTDGYIGNPRATAENMQAEINALYTALDNHQIRVAAGWNYYSVETEELKNFGPGVIDGSQPVVDGSLTDVTGTADIYLQNQKRRALYVSLQDQWQFANDWSLTGGVRWDDFSDFGSTINPRLALVWETDHDLTTKLLYGAAFRAPSFNEQHLRNNPSALGNSELQPEEIETLELVFNYHPSFNSSVTLSLFHYEATDLIAAVPEGNTLRYQNARNQDGYGSELEASWMIDDRWTLQASYAYQRSKDADTGRRIADAPQHTTYTDLTYLHNNRWQASVQHYWIGSRTRPVNDAREKVDDYHWVNARLTHSIDPSMKVSLIVKNLLNTDAREPSSSVIPDDIPLEGRSVWAEFIYSF